jgi:hypothetical protein
MFMLAEVPAPPLQRVHGKLIPERASITSPRRGRWRSATAGDSAPISRLASAAPFDLASAVDQRRCDGAPAIWKFSKARAV